MNSIFVSRSRWLARLGFLLGWLLPGIQQQEFFQTSAPSQGCLEPGTFLICVISFGAEGESGRHDQNFNNPSMKCFVTGASGFIGSNLVQELTARGHRV